MEASQGAGIQIVPAIAATDQVPRGPDQFESIAGAAPSPCLSDTGLGPVPADVRAEGETRVSFSVGPQDTGLPWTRRPLFAERCAGKRLPIRLDLAELVTSRVDQVLERVPLDGDRLATVLWVAEANALLESAGERDRARLLEMRAVVGANTAADRGPALTEQLYKDAVDAAILYERVGELLPAATNYAAAAIVAARADDLGMALQSAVQALVAFTALRERDPVREARLTNMLGILSYQFFDYDRALDFYQQAAQHSRAAGDTSRWSIAQHNVIETLLLQASELGDDPDGRARREELLERAGELSEVLVASGAPENVRTIDGPRLQAMVLCEQGRPAEAWPLLEAATSAAGNPPSRGQVPALRMARGCCLCLLGRPKSAVAELDEVLDQWAGREWDLAERVQALRLRAQARRAAGDLRGALGDVREMTATVWSRHSRQVGDFMDQVWQRAQAERERQDLRERAHNLARAVDQDPLTGLANRRAMERFLQQLGPSRTVVLALVDLDHFKKVNDEYGHRAGDEALREAAGLFERLIGVSGRVARWGGEEFLVVLPGATEDLVGVVEHLRFQVEDYAWELLRPGLRLTVSAGVARGRVGSLSELLSRADTALYRAKRGGRNRVEMG
ncbi:MAG: hypothetical protein QG608_121 [Actinomycetota bacterium]|nr:hypothetical protein [Actinomycetota bacterium]